MRGVRSNKQQGDIGFCRVIGRAYRTEREGLLEGKKSDGNNNKHTAAAPRISPKKTTKHDDCSQLKKGWG
jgi:hypothetical protein